MTLDLNIEDLPLISYPVPPFQMSMVLRNAHTTITEEYGYPPWVSYAAFGLATILLGAILGLVSTRFVPLSHWPLQVL